MNRNYKSLVKSTLLGQLLQNIKLNYFKRKWIRNNKHNGTIPINIFRHGSVTVGCYSYGELNIISFNFRTKLTIGNFVSIAQNVSFLLDVEHYIDHLSTYPFKVKMLNDLQNESFSKGNIVVEDDVWIGYGATIMSGVHIGKGAIIAAGAIVSKNVPAYAIVGGVPAKVIKYRFSSEVIEIIKALNFNNLSYDKVVAVKDLLYTPIYEENVKEVLDELMNSMKEGS